MIKSYKDLEVYNCSYEIAMIIFHTSRSFPKEELYSLTSQMISASRSISANIVEGWAKREYEKTFKRHLIDALGSCQETQNWIKFAYDCKYLNQEDFNKFDDELNKIGKMLTRLHQNWRKF